MTKIIDVTDQVDFGLSDDEFLPLLKCMCGRTWGMWDHSISIYQRDPIPCDKCGRKLIFQASVKVLEVVDD